MSGFSMEQMYWLKFQMGFLNPLLQHGDASLQTIVIVKQ